MENFPAEIYPLLVPDPDTLAALLFTCKWANGCLSNGGPFKLECYDREVRLRNSQLKFSFYPQSGCLLCEKEYSDAKSIQKFSKEDLIGGNKTPIYIRPTITVTMITSHIGWDRIKYSFKYKYSYGRSGTCGLIQRTDCETGDQKFLAVQFYRNDGEIQFNDLLIDTDEALRIVGEGKYFCAIYKQIYGDKF